MTVVLPEAAFRASTSQRCLEEVATDRDARYEHLFRPGQETLGRFFLAPFQRPAVWTDSQSARLIESVHLGISIGSIVVSDCGSVSKVRVGDDVVERFPETAEWLIDGQQRLRAVVRFLADDLVVFAGTPSEHRFSDLSEVQRRRFMNHTIGFIRLEPMPRGRLAEVYDLLNFGGTPHEAHQRASDQATD